MIAFSLPLFVTLLVVSLPDVAQALSLNSSTRSGRRAFLAQTVIALPLVLPDDASAAVTDETDNFGDNWWSSDANRVSSSSTKKQEAMASPSDEIHVRIDKQELIQSTGGGGLGLELADIDFRTNIRVRVKSVRPGSLASKLGIQKDWIVVAVNGRSTERTNTAGVAQILGQEIQRKNSDSIDLCFRDPSIFRERLQSLSEGESVTTQVAPAGDTTQRRTDGSIKPGYKVTQQTDQSVTVTQVVAPPMCKRGATTDDLLEISYVGRVLETGDIFDGSSVKVNGQAIPGRGNDVSLFFVLGKQPFGQFPPGWDVGLVGICVGERRRLVIPPGLAYGSTGVPKRGIPANATLQYDVTLVSLNGLATPQ